jgi:hypothetical protein
VRAVFDARTITVYQAYSSAIAEPAIAAGRFVPPFKLDRMTWIKPSFLWKMYLSGWATKPGQERVVLVQELADGRVIEPGAQGPTQVRSAQKNQLRIRSSPRCQ